ncbi:MAG: signal peptide peptidase SppA [Candidatus Woesearchaeota archaeon]
MKNNQAKQEKGGNRWTVVIVILVVLAMISFISSFFIGLFISASDADPQGNVAHIAVTGPIMSYSSNGLLSDEVASSTDIVRLIKKADKNPEVKAILLEINSPGGTAVASSEIADAVLASNKTTVAWIREAGASGAYWIASAADHIVANPMSITGSIGVIASYIEFSGTLNRYNASYQRLVSGKLKDMGSPWKQLSDEEEEVLQTGLDLIRNEFVSAVAKNRKLSVEAVDEIADGRFYIGRQALELGLVDQLGGKDDAVAWIEDKEDIIAELAKYQRPTTLLDIIGGVFDDSSYHVGQGIGKALFDTRVSNGVEVRT